MQRSKQILVASHCVLNQNAVAPGGALSPGILRSAVDWASDQGYGIFQLPCPELTFWGPDRPRMTVEECDTPEFHAHNRSILQPAIEQLKVYQMHGYEIVGGLGIAGSPSCDPGKGIFMNDFLMLAKEQGVHIDFFWQIPDTEEGRFDPRDKNSVHGPVGVQLRTVSVKPEKARGRKRHGLS
ncbi:CD3072 family TudS-related putative desulfidase [Paenibacillus dendrobii]|uniref:CD3072 family TudS-related putative desulfidase n=1 Tax=Paenibacillus dendrobii TaxID=2691084 RepID=UPI001924B6A7|nr:CD3072 family TudS-related putative desulfidase [Paenibacillus dendrobii]